MVAALGETTKASWIGGGVPPPPPPPPHDAHDKTTARNKPGHNTDRKDADECKLRGGIGADPEVLYEKIFRLSLSFLSFKRISEKKLEFHHFLLLCAFARVPAGAFLFNLI